MHGLIRRAAWAVALAATLSAPLVGVASGATELDPAAASRANGTSGPEQAWLRYSPYISGLQDMLSPLGGFANVTYDDASEPTVVVRWKGTPPAQVADRLATAPSGLRVQTVQVRYDVVELQRAATDLVAAAPPESGAAAAPSVDASGVDALMTTSSAPGAARTAGAGVPVRQVPAAGVPEAVGRQSDTSPFYGGAQVRNRDNQTQCSTGFRMRTSVGGYRMVTAFHCNALVNSGSYFNTYNADKATVGLTVGRSGNGFTSVDAQFLTPPSGSSYSTRIYNGAYNSSSSIDITGDEAPVVGGYVCISGAFSGVICSNKVLQTEVTTQVRNINGALYTVKHAFITSQTGGVAAAGHGDSGGPVYVSASVGAHAVGIITAEYSQYAKPCRGAYWVLEACSSRVLVMSIRAIESASGYSVG